MKNLIIKSMFVVAAGITLAAGNTGCAKIEDFGTINTRSDASSVAVTGYLLTNAESNIASIMTGGIRPSLYSQQFAETQYTDVSIYGVPQIDFGGIYAGYLEDVQKIIDLNLDPATKSTISVAGSGSNGNQLGIARILKSYIFWTITDRWGDVPYSQALKETGNLTPAYDKQQDIYKGLLKDLKDGIVSFDGGTNATGDIFYSGSPVKWKKLANSLRMLIALRMSKVDPAFAQSEFAAAYADANGAIVTNADNLVAAYFDGATALTTNVWYAALNGRKDYAFSLTLHDILNNMGDARRSAYGTSGASFPYGLKRDDAVAFEGSVSGNVARLFALKNQNTPIVIVPAAYVLLAMAEASDRGWIGGSAQAFYESGVTASFAQWGVSGAAAYLAGPNANFLSGAGGGSIGANSFGSIVGSNAITSTPRQRIQLQRYLASFGDGIQAWSEWRRTGVPNLKPTAYGTNTPKEIPRRYTYGVNEYATNPTGVAGAAGRLAGGDLMSSKMWWDQ